MTTATKKLAYKIIILSVLFSLGTTTYYYFSSNKKYNEQPPGKPSDVTRSTSSLPVKLVNKNIPAATSTKAISVSQKMCSTKSTDTDKSVCYLQLAKETGDLGYCWKYQANFSICVNDVILYRHDPSLCYHLHPDSQPGCLKAFYDNE